MSKAKSSVMACVIVYMSVIFPFFYRNNYIDIMQAKRSAFLVGGVAAIAGMMVLTMLDLLMGNRSELRMGQLVKNQFVQKRLGSLGVVLLMVSWGVSWILSIDKTEAFWGIGSKCVGLFVYLVGIILIILLSKYLEWTALLSWAFMVGSFGVCILQVLNRWGIDPLSMYENLIPEQHSLFISTIGQVNYNASLNGLILAVLMGWFLLANDKFSTVIYGFVMFVAFCGSISCCSESIYLLLAAIIYIQFIYIVRHPEKWYRFVAELFLLLGSIVFLWIVWTYGKSAHFWGVSFWLFHTKLLFPMTAAWVGFLVLGLFAYKLCGGRRGWKYFCIASMLVVPIAGVYIFTRIFQRWELRAELEWAGYRLDIWNRCWKVFADAPIQHKLFGYGFNNVNQALSLYGIGEQGGLEIQDAHNILLNSLITSGLVGTTLLFSLLGWLLIQLTKNIKNKPEAIIGGSIIMVYLVQGILNGPQILTEPAYMVAFGAAGRFIRK